jgi:exonuclease SbcD
MPRFAHMSDIHIGAFGPQELKDQLLSAFEKAIDICMKKGVDFVIMAGDIFDSNIPDLSSVKRATAKIREAIDEGIRFYVVYGSHDFSPNYTSMVDVLESAGLFVKVDRHMLQEGKLLLQPVKDETGATLTGLSGKRLSLDRLDYESLDLGAVKKEEGFKIFVFHGALEELKPAGLERMDAMSAKLLPEDFNYYAGGHVHYRSLGSLPGRKNIAYPGPLFGGDFRDLESAARGEKRGLYIVDFDSDVRNVEFVTIEVCDIIELEYSAEGKNSAEVQMDLVQLASSARAEGAVVLLRVKGEMSGGRVSDIDFTGIRRELRQRGALYVVVGYGQLTSKEEMQTPAVGKSKAETELEFFRAGIDRVKVSEDRLKGDAGVKTSLELLRVLKQPRKENETKSDYERRMFEAGRSILGLKEVKR